jgi:hypothetical protein
VTVARSILILAASAAAALAGVWLLRGGLSARTAAAEGSLDDGPPGAEGARGAGPGDQPLSRALSALSGAAHARAGDPARVVVPAELSPFQRAVLDHPRAIAHVQQEIGGVLASRRAEAERCMRGVDAVGPVRLDCRLAITAGAAEVSVTRMRCDRVLDGMPVPDSTLRCIEQALGSPFQVPVPARLALPGGWSDELPFDPLAMGEADGAGANAAR